jgi:hypothetical protein
LPYKDTQSTERQVTCKCRRKTNSGSSRRFNLFKLFGKSKVTPITDVYRYKYI